MQIYLITNKINGKRYVGQTTQSIEANLSKAHIGKVSGMLGKKHTKASRKQMSVTKKAKVSK